MQRRQQNEEYLESKKAVDVEHRVLTLGEKSPVLSPSPANLDKQLRTFKLKKQVKTPSKRDREHYMPIHRAEARFRRRNNNPRSVGKVPAPKHNDTSTLEDVRTSNIPRKTSYHSYKTTQRFVNENRGHSFMLAS